MEPQWLALNRANWDERVAVHRAVQGTDRAAVYRTAALDPLVTEELGPVAGLSLLHLQCHYGRDTLALARLGAVVTGLDFSGPAIDAARADAAAEGLAATFVHAAVFDAPNAVAQFDRVFTTWGTIGWLPDIERWAQVVAGALKPGGRFYFADIHPVALVFDDMAREPDGRPGWFAPYFERGPIMIEDPSDYADPAAKIVNARTVQFMHPLGAIVGALQAAGLRLDWLHEHDRVAWQAFRCLVADGEMWRWPERAWFPLALSLMASKPDATGPAEA